MKVRPNYLYTLLGMLVFIASCNSQRNAGNANAPIILGNPNTIVTEADSQNLKDFVTDLKPVEHTDAEQETEKQPAAADTPKEEPKQETAAVQPKEEKEQEAEDNAPAGNGLNAAFKEVTISIPSVTTRTFKQQNLQRSNSASYQLTGGNLNGSQIKISNGSQVKISQRYETMVALKNSDGTLPLDALTTTTSWQPLRGRGNAFVISGLDAGHLTYPKASPSAIRNAVTKAARRQRMNRKEEQQLLNSIRSVRAANQRPLTVVLRSVMWKIDGKDSKGKPYQKQIRIDIPS